MHSEYSRARTLNFILNLDLSQDIPRLTLHNMLRNNLGAAELLILLHVDNLCDWEQQYDTMGVLGEQDREQWEVSTKTWDTFSSI